MESWDELLNKIENYDKEWKKNLNPVVRSIVEDAQRNDITEDEWFELLERIKDFIKTNPSEKDRMDLRGTASIVYRVCLAIKSLKEKNKED